ncbi:transglycosylase SLT domain-containing protein [Martelella alba]|nr:transglycosylase SLT domain-containing protein [Martelella alba]
MLLFMAALILAGCARQPPERTISLVTSAPPQVPPAPAPKGRYGDYIHTSASIYGIDENLVKAIIKVESGYNPDAVSRSNAIGLMQLKAATAGRDAYRLKGRYGQPSTFELKDPATNIDLGTAYLGILKRQLSGIKNPQTLRYALTVAYVNGAGALLRSFSRDRDRAIAMINTLTPAQFYRHVQTRHPAPQAPRYLWKVNTAYLAMVGGENSVASSADNGLIASTQR